MTSEPDDLATRNVATPQLLATLLHYKPSKAMMRKLFITAVAALFATSAFAQQDNQNPAKPDYSRPTLLRVLSADNDQPPHSAIEFDVGTVTFHTLGTTWQFDYLPFHAPFQGSVNRGRGFGSDMPNAFALTGTEMPFTPRTWREGRAMSEEMKRIERSERAKVRVKPE
jgi:hypothetical protein